MWLSETQGTPLVDLQSEIDPLTGMRYLTCYLLPQQPTNNENSDGEQLNQRSRSAAEMDLIKPTAIQFDAVDSDVRMLYLLLLLLLLVVLHFRFINCSAKSELGGFPKMCLIDDTISVMLEVMELEPHQRVRR